MRRFFVLFLVGIFASLSFNGVLGEEDQNFPPTNASDDFSYGYTNVLIEYADGKTNELLAGYPSNHSEEDGLDAPIVDNLDAPLIFFIGDESESIEQYQWLQASLAQNGIISFVIQSAFIGEENPSDMLLLARNAIAFGNDTSELGESMFLDCNFFHWGVGGHGLGAYLAAESLYNWPNEYASPPRALFGLGLEMVSQQEHDLSKILPRPSVALFITGTVDEITPADEHVEPYLENWPGGWQVVHAFGANHIQYQESSTFIEGLVDGDPTMTVEEQRQHAMHRLLPYINLTLRGDDTAWFQAFSRENGDVPSSTEAYYDEDLNQTRLYRLDEVYLSDSVIGIENSSTVSMNVTTRARGMAEGNVTCHVDGANFSGILSGFESTCILEGQAISPGIHSGYIKISDGSFSDWQTFAIIRESTPMSAFDPAPVLIFSQRSSGTMESSEMAVDPDGENIQILNATLLSNLSQLSLSYQDENLTISHVQDEQWFGFANASVHLRAGWNDELNVTIQIEVQDVNDPLQQVQPVPPLTGTEDQGPLVIDLKDYVEDPEGASSVIDEVMENSDFEMNFDGTILTITPSDNWNGAAIIEVMMSDAVTEPISIEVPVQVQSMDDAMIVNQSAWNLTMDEDAGISISLNDFAYDIDNELTWKVNGNSQNVIIDVYGQGDNATLRLTGVENKFGLDSNITLNVSSPLESYQYHLQVMIQPQPDVPEITILTTTLQESRIDVLWTIMDPDLDDTYSFRILWDHENGTGTHACTGDDEKTCASAIDLPSPRNDTMALSILVWDEAANAWSNEAKIDVTFSGELLQTSTQTTSDGLTTTLLYLAAVVIILLILVFFSIRKKELEIIENNETNDADDSQNIGLLERARAKS